MQVCILKPQCLLDICAKTQQVLKDVTKQKLPECGHLLSKSQAGQLTQSVRCQADDTVPQHS